MSLTIPVNTCLFMPTGADLDGLVGSVGCRFRTSAGSGQHVALIGRHSNGAANGAVAGFVVYIFNSTNQLAMEWKDPSNNLRLQAGNAGPTVRDGLWHSMVMCFDRATSGLVSMYVDGAFAFSGTISSTVNFASQIVRFGEVASLFFSTKFSGDMADMCWWDVSLTAGEAEAYTKGFSPRLIRPQSLVRYVPAVRNVAELVGDPAIGFTGCTPGAVHPRVIGPSC